MRNVHGERPAVPRPGQPSATILQSAVCRTTGIPRPCPSLFYFPGLHSRPVWSRADALKAFPWLNEMEKEENVAALRREYEALVQNGIESDYSTKDLNRAGGEHKMHSGNVFRSCAEFRYSACTFKTRIVMLTLLIQSNNTKSNQIKSGEWSWHTFISKGVAQDKVASTCPVTSRLLTEVTRNVPAPPCSG